ncbi:hypothetical protein PORY_001649 [Pneumocystis oryctolagi]|uniref:Uncharacterized protein n=1 Tax=Pneumocystis oryctolagi TaxID=42067 RepID=A0ACB7CB65_9ASCO|nr:hypothetical protein PORY_001649 [Pneumocystis oryctolagi]
MTTLRNSEDCESGSALLECLENASLASSVLTIRLIKSFVHRTIKYLVLHNVDLARTTVFALQQRIQKEIINRPGFQAYATVPFDTLKIYAHAHGTKVSQTSNRVINLDNDEWILSDPSMTLIACGVQHETELSFFRRVDYEQFKTEPHEKW